MGTHEVLEEVRDRYAQAALAVVAHEQVAGCCGPQAEAGCCGPQAEAFVDNEEKFGSALYDGENLDGLPEEAVLASLGCGNPLVVAALEPGERVLDLGSGGGIDVLLSAKRVGPTGRVFGLDMTDEMLALARANAAKAGATNVEFLKGQIEAIPLPANSIDVVISNCVINLSVDKPAVLAEMFRVLVPGGRIGISDVVAEDDVTPEQRAERGSYVGCIAGALSRSEYLAGLAAAGFTDASVEFTHEATPGLHGAIIRATKPAQLAEPAEPKMTARQAPQDAAAASSQCCTPAEQSQCCEPEAKADCCGASADSEGQPATAGCGCR